MLWGDDNSCRHPFEEALNKNGGFFGYVRKRGFKEDAQVFSQKSFMYSCYAQLAFTLLNNKEVAIL